MECAALVYHHYTSFLRRCTPRRFGALREKIGQQQLFIHFVSSQVSWAHNGVVAASDAVNKPDQILSRSRQAAPG